MRRAGWASLGILLAMGTLHGQTVPPAAKPLPPAAKSKVDYTRDIEPLLAKRCQLCHGPQQQMSGLRLDQKEAALKGGASGADILPGNSAGSRLIRLVSGVEAKVMPPMGARLTATEIGLLRAWIDQGALWPVQQTGVSKGSAQGSTQGSTHWAFQKITRPTPPVVRDRAWPRNAIDNFILAKLESQTIKPSPEASKTTLLRRVSLDITGLPPTPQEVDAFLNDNRPDAYERLVDRLLASPHYGEKWARYWLDLARYADSDGYEKDRSRPWAWRYRQWVIEALNRDLPFDEFTTQQLAGDLLPDRNIDTLVATGFNRNTLTNREGGTDPEQFRDEQVLDRAATLGTVWMGLTVGCAQCHNHKYDPISQQEFYQLTAFFNTQEEVNIPAPLPGEIGPYLAARPEYDERRWAMLEEYKIPAAETDWEDKLRYAQQHPTEHDDWIFAYGEFTHSVDSARKVLFTDPAKRSEVQQTAMIDYFLSSCGSLFPKQYCADLKLGELRTKLNALNAKLPPYSFAPVLLENDTPPKTYIHVKGDWREHGPEVQPGTLAVLPPLPAGGKPTRLVLARWLVSPENPLTSRVAVNRIWQELFGRGIVNTSEDFGTQGDRPSHPELLDWLASEFRNPGTDGTLPGSRKIPGTDGTLPGETPGTDITVRAAQKARLGTVTSVPWSLKKMVRLIVTSATYRQRSDIRPELTASDPENTLLARQSRLRLPAELIRDEALYAAGLLDLRIGGKSVKPPQPKGVAELSYAGSVKWEDSSGADRYRRGLYVHFQRTTPYPQLMNFDAPSSNLSCTRRERTDTPLQALNLMNDPVFFEAAQGLAFRVMREGATTGMPSTRGGFRDKLNYAYQVTLGRQPSAHEVERLGKYFDEALHKLADVPQTVAALFPNRIQGVPQTDAAAWVELSRVLLNLDEFITRD
ncbi:MAG: PSD1 and planctomycete cytochrome C domain-containing protein [Acidobacteriia bacterium]|nr:PSD1 and planctomycete cytochrome C domain-containing protein [Terriglobia bacterium]